MAVFAFVMVNQYGPSTGLSPWSFTSAVRSRVPNRKWSVGCHMCIPDFDLPCGLPGSGATTRASVALGPFPPSDPTGHVPRAHVLRVVGGMTVGGS